MIEHFVERNTPRPTVIASAIEIRRDPEPGPAARPGVYRFAATKAGTGAKGPNRAARRASMDTLDSDFYVEVVLKVTILRCAALCLL